MDASESSMNETLWHVTVLSNLIRGYDKYSRAYSKSRIPESTFADRFFLLRESELRHGVAKARPLLQRLDIPGNRLVALRTAVSAQELRANTRTGIGRFVERDHIILDAVGWLGEETRCPRVVPIEEACAQSLKLLRPQLWSFDAMRPRSFSVLPIANACQAACPFCFSDASVSADQAQARLQLAEVSRYASLARQQGAERFVITGGGEPGLVRHSALCELIAAGSAALGKSVLITNGHHLALHGEADRAQVLADYADAGLRVLAISRHHHDAHTNRDIMRLDTDAGAVARTWSDGRSRWPELQLRLICVLQRGGVENRAQLEAYLTWAVGLGVSEVCFKELYVSTSVESVYYRHSANAWSHANQVPLAIVRDAAAARGLREVDRLPWGAPIFAGEWNGRPLRIAAYTEPSLLWERSEGIARSWNLMADGRCLASLEDRASELQATVKP
jgi:organic radical activating enzyme